MKRSNTNVSSLIVFSGVFAFTAFDLSLMIDIVRNQGYEASIFSGIMLSVTLATLLIFRKQSIKS